MYTNNKLCPSVLISIPDRAPEMDEKWTFGVYSGLYAKFATYYMLGFYIGQHLS
jgi:hypothetical protein